MSKPQLINFIIGYGLLILGVGIGGYVTNQIEESLLYQNPSQLMVLKLAIMKSSHGHTNLFGMLHILVALSFPYLLFPRRMLWWITGGLSLGSFGMSVLLLTKSFFLFDAKMTGYLSIGIGLCLTGALLAIMTCFVGMVGRLARF